MSCHTNSKELWLASLESCVPFLVVLYLQYCMLEDSPPKCEIHDIYIYICDMQGVPMAENLVGRNQVGPKLSD